MEELNLSSQVIWAVYNLFKSKFVQKIEPAFIKATATVATLASGGFFSLFCDFGRGKG